jgi:transcriptional regulator with XRE-family HTH domain/tetratricopeptide (TPR) repeat protein
MGRERLAARRRELGLTQEQVAYTLGRDPATIGRWERGESVPQPLHRRPYADVLQITLADLNGMLAGDRAAVSAPPPIATAWTPSDAHRLCDAIEAVAEAPITAETAPRLVVEWLVVEPPQSVELRSGRRVGMDLATQVARRVERLRRLDDHVAGADLERAVARELTVTTHLVREGSYTDAIGRRMLAALGDLCQLAGWAAADAGRDRDAAHYYATGTSAAHAAGDGPLAGQLVSSLAYHVTNKGDLRDAVLIAQSAIAGTAATATPTTRALFLDRLAWTCANAADRPQAERALGLAEETFMDSQPEDDPTWSYWLTGEELDVMAGRCFVELGLPDLARPRLERALDGYDEDRPREAALYWSWLAEAELQRGDVDHAAALASHVLDLTAHTASTRSSDRVRHLRDLLRSHRGRPSVDAFEDRYQAAVA